MFYVYILFRPWNGIPCYVGKGKGRRWLSHEALGGSHYNKHLGRIVVKAGGKLPKIKVREALTEAEAIKTEIALIAAIGRKLNGGPLVNLTDGGDGVVGLPVSKELAERRAAPKRGKKRPPEVVAKISATKMGHKHSPTTIANLCKASATRWARKGERERIGIATAAGMANPIVIEKMREAKLGKPRSRARRIAYEKGK